MALQSNITYLQGMGDARSARRDPSAALSRRVVFGSAWRAGVYDEILHGHPAAYNGMLQVLMSFAGSSPHVEAVSDESAEESVFRQRCERAFDTAIFDDNPNTDASDILSHLASAVLYGAAVFEIRWDAGVLSICPIPLHSISRWEVIGPYRVPVQGDNDAPIPPERLVRVTIGEFAGPEGIGVLRPIVFLFELWKQTLQDMGVRAGKENGGLIVTQDRATPQDALVSAQENLDKFTYGEVGSLILPPGYTSQQVTLPPASSNLQLVEYCDQQIRQLVDETLTSLITSDTGNRALGDALAEDNERALRNKLEYCVTKFGQQLFGAIAMQWDYAGRLPRMTTVQHADNPDARLNQMRQNAMITGWYDADRDEARRVAGLPPISEAGAVVEIQGPAPMMLAKRLVKMDELPDVVDVSDLVMGRRRDEEALSNSIFAIAQSYRPDIIDAHRNDNADELVSLHADFVNDVKRAVDDFISTRRRKAYAFGKRYIQRYSELIDIDELQESDPLFDPGIFERAATERAAKQAEESAETIWNRVEGEVREQVAVRDDVQPTRITPNGLAQSAHAAGHTAEQAGRMSGVASEGARVGLVVVGAWRVSFEDGNRCDVCTARTGVFWPADNLPQLPDPDCEGGVARCRCGLMPVLRRIAT